MEKQTDFRVIEARFKSDFEQEVKILITSGWQIISSNCSTETFEDKSVGRIYTLMMVKMEDKSTTPPPASAYK